MCVYVGMSFMGYILVWQSDGTFGFPPQKYIHIQQHTKICIKFQGFLFKFMNSTPQNIKMEHPWKCEGFTEAQKVKNLPAIQETQVWSLGWEDTLEKGLATHSSTPPNPLQPSTPAWRIPWTEESDWLQSMGSQRVRQDWVTNTFTVRETDLVGVEGELGCTR